MIHEKIDVIERAEIEKASSECGEHFEKIRKTLKATPLSVRESDLLDCFNFVRAKKIASSEPLIKEKALRLAKKHNGKEFSASIGWIDHYFLIGVGYLNSSQQSVLRNVLGVTEGWCHDEAHFWLNGYINKQNCRIWSEANPQVYVETPLHPEKLTVWCALWAGGILLQKR
ncbi:hypothetical protein TNCV_887241 [Trichonephila clavipes]|uniref:HTH CENPB-type domain-containing protein n=1 Tax=Trichonephila clavipes TaxID=2585209 RepID=A0A8X6R7W4_TRICX|nr:hypothetical protein TNCV_887241 [Trichonephila clavipes]